MLFVCYEKCGTCRKAKKYLEEHGIPFEERKIREMPPNETELRLWQKESGLPVRKLFNTSGKLYKEMNLKDKLRTMSEDEMFKLLASDGMLVKRPLAVMDGKVLVGFREAEWEETFK